MSFSDTAWRLRLTATTGFAEFRVAAPLWIIATTYLPRAILQTLFFTLLGRVIDGPQAEMFAYVGGAAAAMTLSGTVAVMEVPLTDVWFGTFYRLRTGLVRPFTVFLLRAMPYPVLGLVFSVTALAVVGPVTGQLRTTLDLLPWLPVYLLMSVTTTAAGLACAALVIGRQANVLAGNLLSYLILLASGVFLQPGQLPWVDYIGAVLPIRHGLEAVRAGMAGRPWAGELLIEVAVGACWLALAWAVVAIQVRRSYRQGIDSFS